MPNFNPSRCKSCGPPRRVRIVAILLSIGSLIHAHAASWTPTHVPLTNSPLAVLATSSPTQSVHYRCFIRVQDNMATPQTSDLWRDSITLSLSAIPGPCTVLINGQVIAQSAAIPDNSRRRFKVPKDILQKKSFNALTLRLEKDAAHHGLRQPPILAGYHDELVLEGTWEVWLGSPPQEDLRAVPQQPERAFFTEAHFRESSTPLAINAELLPGERLAPAQSLALFNTPDDLAVDLLLAEPQIAQPTHFSFDARGRLWVAQYRQYPYPAGLTMISRDKYYRSRFDRVPPPPPQHDRGRDIISVHEDTDGDGTYDRHRNVITGLNMANAVVHGHGGIWVMQTPYLLFYPDADGDDVPDRDPEVRLAGFGLEDTHSVANGLAWGPEGWLYGAQGSTTTSRILRPGTDPSDSPGVYYEGCMVWRYHPESRTYEIFAEGGGNNFGLEFDAEGRLYSGHNGGETRGWHFVQQGVYLKQGKDPGKFGPPTNPYAFGELPMIRSSNAIARFTHHFSLAEGTALPAPYQGRLFAADPLHRNIVLSDRIPALATFATADRGFALQSDDKAFRPVFVANAPDGSVYIADFYEEFIAHGQHYQSQIDPDSGRLYRLRGRQSPLLRDINLARLSTPQLLATLGHSNRWHRQTAVALLAQRHDPSLRPALAQLLLTPQLHPALEALWTLHQADLLDTPTAFAALQHPAPPVRAWTIRLMGDASRLHSDFAQAILHLLPTEPDPEVRCQIASTAKRLPSHQALPLIAALLTRDADTDDPFIPLLCWGALESVCASNRQAVLDLFTGPASSPQTTNLWTSSLSQKHILPRLMRRFATPATRADLIACAQLLEAAPGQSHRQQLLADFEQAFKGRVMPALPEPLLVAMAKSGPASLLLQVRQRQPAALTQALALITNSQTPASDRILYTRAFGEVQWPDSIPILLAIARNDSSTDLRRTAFAALSLYDDPRIGQDLAIAYAALPVALHPNAQNLLASRATWALAFLKQLQQTTSNSPPVLSPETLARLRLYKDPEIASLVRKLWPEPASSARANSLAIQAKVRQRLQAAPGNPYAGEPLFLDRCASCHQLFHKGGRIGPDLTPYQRDDLTTLLPSILDPNAEIREGFENILIETKDGRSLSGFLADQDAATLVLRGFDGQDLTLARDTIASLEPAGRSLMPEGLLDNLSDQQLRDLFAYLRIPQPISK